MGRNGPFEPPNLGANELLGSGQESSPTIKFTGIGSLGAVPALWEMGASACHLEVDVDGRQVSSSIHGVF